MSQAVVLIGAGICLALWAASYMTGSAFVGVVAAVASAFTLGGWTFGIRKRDVEPSQKPAASVPQTRPPSPAPSTSAGTPTSPSVAKSLRLIQPDTATSGAVVQSLLRNGAFAGRPIAAHLWLQDPSSATLRLVTAAGEQRPSSRPVSADDGTLGQAVTSGRAILAPLQKLTSEDGESTTWRYAVPVSSAEAVGVAAIDFAGSQSPSTEALTEIFAALHVSLAAAIALHVARQRENASRTLMEAARKLTRYLDPAQVLRAALETAMSLSDASTGSIMLLSEDDSRLTIAVASGLPDDVVNATDISIGEGIAGWVAASGKPLLVEDLPGRPGRSDRHGIRSAVSVPISDEDGLLGILNVGSRTFPARFTSEHLDTLELLARQAAVAYRNAVATRSSRDLYFDSLKALALALETKDPYAQGGTERVLEYAQALGKAMGLEASALRALEIAAMLHDVGMSGLANSTSANPRPLSTVERGLIKMHPAVAADILEQTPALQEVAPIVYHHHEHFDGGGYVDGISGEMIPLGARVLAVADAYVAMTSDRPYRAAKPHAVALRELQEKAGTQFDPDVVQAFVDLQGMGADRVPDREH